MSRRLPFGLARYARAFTGCAIALAATSCSRALKMSVVDPGALVAVPAKHGESGPPTFTRSSLEGPKDDGVLVISGDSMVVYSRIEAGSTSLRNPRPATYQQKRVVSELRITGYQPAAIHWREWEGLVRASGDSLEFLREGMKQRGLRRGSHAETLRVPARAISGVEVEQTDVVHTVVVITLVTALLVGIAAIGFAAGNSGFWGD